MAKAATVATAAAMARPLSNPLTVATWEGACRGAGTAGAETAERCAVGGAATRAPVPPVEGVGGLGPVPGAAGVATGAAEAVGGGGAPVGNVGSLIVGEAVGLGGKLMRTVSFFG